jgi:predicted secreted hydrolase
MTKRARALGVAATLALSLAAITGSLLVRRPRPAGPAVLSVSSVLGGTGATGFARATLPRRFVFPEDHGPHPDFRSEWWYTTGQLRAGSRRFGYQLTIFRQALAAAGPPRTSAWATRQVYLGHLAITDVDGVGFMAFEQVAREGLDLGGARARPYRVWALDWTMAGLDGGQDLFPLSLRARGADEAHSVELALTLDAGRGPVLQGDEGLSRKGPEPGNASYYYSCTRLPTVGRLGIDGTSFEVTGTSWLDREWSTSALAPATEGWDWLALHLSDGRDVMIYRLRRRDGGTTAESRATVIDRNGGSRVVGPEAFRFVPAAFWRSPRTAIRYPVGVTVQIPSADLTLEVRPLLEDQELRLSLQYWEGAVEARGRAGGRAVTGSGYLELAGYTARR